jgi:hypothetical protein
MGSTVTVPFQRLASFLLPTLALATGGLLACTEEPGTSGNGGGAAGTGTANGGGGAGGIIPLGGAMAAGMAGTSGGQSGQAGQAGALQTGGAGASNGGAAQSGGTGGGGSTAGGNAGSSGSGGGAVGCEGFSGKFCDDFEAQTSGQAPSGDFSVQGKVVVDSSKAYSGSKSIRIQNPTPTGMLRFSEQFPFNDLHGRAMFFVTGIPTDGGPHWDLVVAVANDDDNHNWEIGGMYGDWLFIIDPPDRGVGAGAFPLDKWFCLQWQYKFAGSGQANTFVAKMDGTSLENAEFTGQDAEGFAWNAGPWGNLSVGFTAYGGNIAVDMWVDDLAFGEAPIACPPAK